MSTINGNVCVVDGVAVDKVFSNGKQVYGRNLFMGTSAVKTSIIKAGTRGYAQTLFSIVGGETYTYSISMITMGHTGHSSIAWLDANKAIISIKAGNDYLWAANGGRFSNTFIAPINAVYASLTPWYFSQVYTSDTNISWYHEKFELGDVSTPWTPAPEDVLKGDITAPNNLV